MTRVTKVPTQKDKPKQYKRGIDWLSEQIDLSILFRIKGRPGLWMPKSVPKKNGMVRMEEFGSEEECTIDKKNLTGLNNLGIRMYDQSVLPFTEALDNLQKYAQNNIISNDWHITEIGALSTMEVICPGYDNDSFKVYHARKAIQWYNELIIGIRNASKES